MASQRFIGGTSVVFDGSSVADFPGNHKRHFSKILRSCFTFAMENAPEEEQLAFRGFEDIQAGIVKWPMSVIRLRGSDPARIADLADKILTCWRGYTDESVGVVALRKKI